MKKSIFLAIPLLILSATIAYALDTADWYVYNGISENHSFSVKFPPEWKVYATDEEQKFGPKEDEESRPFAIKQFIKWDYDEAIDYFVNEENKVVNIFDEVRSTNYEDILVKEVQYSNSTRTFIKRGNIVFALSKTTADSPLDETLSAINNSFSFTDNWHQYINYNQNYTFNFPNSLQIKNVDSGVLIHEKNQPEDEILEIIQVSEKTEQKDHILYLENEDEIIKITSLSNSEYLPEIIYSFEFFDVEKPLYDFQHFPDVRDNHSNATSINHLKNEGIIAGYPDGTFLPDGEINRAELTKMVVAVKGEPNAEKFQNCFPDVEDQWFAPYVCYAQNRKWVAGYPDGTFQPGNPINRIEAIKIVMEVLFDEFPETESASSKYSDVDLSQWYGKYFVLAEENELFDIQHVVNDQFLPAENITRKEVAEMIYRSLQLQ